MCMYKYLYNYGEGNETHVAPPRDQVYPLLVKRPRCRLLGLWVALLLLSSQTPKCFPSQTACYLSWYGQAMGSWSQMGCWGKVSQAL